MEPITKRNGILIPHMGIVGASFAALLTIMTMDPAPKLAIAAANNFSIGIPISVATLFFPAIDRFKGHVKKALVLGNIALLYVGSIACMLGLHKCFRLISKQAGDNFSNISLSVFVFLYLWATYDYFVKSMLEESGGSEGP